MNFNFDIKYNHSLHVLENLYISWSDPTLFLIPVYPQSGYTRTPTSAYFFPPTPSGQGHCPSHLQQLRQRGQRRQQWWRGNKKCFGILFIKFKKYVFCFKIFANSWPSALNSKSFSLSLEQVFLKVVHNNFWNKIQFLSKNREFDFSKINFLNLFRTRPRRLPHSPEKRLQKTLLLSHAFLSSICPSNYPNFAMTSLSLKTRSEILILLSPIR